MKTRIIKKNGTRWDFNSVKEAKPFIKKGNLNDFEIIEEKGEKIRVYDDRLLAD
jgi:hypothetical protein